MPTFCDDEPYIDNGEFFPTVLCGTYCARLYFIRGLSTSPRTPGARARSPGSLLFSHVNIYPHKVLNWFTTPHLVVNGKRKKEAASNSGLWRRLRYVIQFCLIERVRIECPHPRGHLLSRYFSWPCGTAQSTYFFILR